MQELRTLALPGRHRSRPLFEQLETRCCPSATSATTVIRSAAPVVLHTPAIHQGDVIIISARMTASSFVGKNGGSEALFVDSNSGYHSVLTLHDETTLLFPRGPAHDYLAAKTGEKFTARFLSFDNDQATITVTALNPTTELRQRFTAQTKSLVAAYENQLLAEGTAEGALANTTHTTYNPATDTTTSVTFGSAGLIAQINNLAALDLLESTRLQNLLFVGPDTSFSSVAPPVTPTVPTVVAGPGITQDVADAFNTLFANETQVLGLTEALTTAVSRASGAFHAHQMKSEMQQLSAASGFVHQLDSLLAGQRALRRGLVATMQVAMIPPFTLTTNDLYNFEVTISSGFPAALLNDLVNLGASAADLGGRGGLQSVASDQDVNALALTFPDAFAAPNLLTATSNLVTALRVDTTPATPHALGQAVQVKLVHARLAAQTLHVTLSVRNATQQAIEGPIVLVFNRALGRGLSLAHADGRTASGSFVGVHLGSTGTLGAGKTVSVVVSLTDTSGATTFRALPHAFQGVFA